MTINPKSTDILTVAADPVFPAVSPKILQCFEEALTAFLGAQILSTSTLLQKQLHVIPITTVLLFILVGLTIINLFSNDALHI